MVSFKHYDAILAQVNKLVRNDEEVEHDPYNNPAPSNSLGLATQLQDNTVSVHAIPEFVFNLKKIQVPFSHNFSFDPYLSRFKYEKDYTTNFTVNCLPQTMRDSLFPF